MYGLLLLAAVYVLRDVFDLKFKIPLLEGQDVAPGAGAAAAAPQVVSPPASPPSQPVVEQVPSTADVVSDLAPSLLHQNSYRLSLLLLPLLLSQVSLLEIMNHPSRLKESDQHRLPAILRIPSLLRIFYLREKKRKLKNGMKITLRKKESSKVLIS